MPRRYTRKDKVAAVTAAAASSVLAAAEASGIPESTLRYWWESPEFAELRDKTREEMASQASVMSQLAMGEIRRKLPAFEPRDLVMLYGVMVDKAQLLKGDATSRQENVEITDKWKDHERTTLREAVVKEVARREQEEAELAKRETPA